MSTLPTLPGRPSSNALLVLVQLEAGRAPGLGHLGRCLAICEELEGQGAFAADGDEAMALLAGSGARVAAGDAEAPIVLIDRPEPTAHEAVAALHAEGRLVCLLDDPGPGRAEADLVVDPPTGIAWPPCGGRRLAGFEHVLLRRDIRAAASTPRADVDVLLSLGGSDPEGLTPAIARALEAAGLTVLTVLGPAYQGPAPIGQTLADSSEWPSALAGARLLVTRFGHTLLEAAHLGTPALAIATSEQAEREARALATHGAAEAIRVRNADDAPAVAEVAGALRGDPIRLETMAGRGRKLIDGRGAERVAAVLRELGSMRRAGA